MLMTPALPERAFRRGQWVVVAWASAHFSPFTTSQFSSSWGIILFGFVFVVFVRHPCPHPDALPLRCLLCRLEARYSVVLCPIQDAFTCVVPEPSTTGQHPGYDEDVQKLPRPRLEWSPDPFAGSRFSSLSQGSDTPECGRCPSVSLCRLKYIVVYRLERRPNYFTLNPGSSTTQYTFSVGPAPISIFNDNSAVNPPVRPPTLFDNNEKSINPNRPNLETFTMALAELMVLGVKLTLFTLVVSLRAMPPKKAVCEVSSSR